MQAITFHVYSIAQGWLDDRGRFTTVLTYARTFHAFADARAARDALAATEEGGPFIVLACIP